MAQPNVAREPSMEEILASIRKIIESNEPGAGKSISSSLPPVYEMSEEDADDIHLTIDDELAAVELDDVPPVPMQEVAMDPRFVAANSSGQNPETAPENRTLSLADVAARVRAASERNASQPSVIRDVPQPRELPPEMAARLAEVRFSHGEEKPAAAEEPVLQTAAPVAPVAAAPEAEPAMASPQDAAPMEAPQRHDDVVVQMRPVETAPQVSLASAESVQPQQSSIPESAPAPTYVQQQNAPMPAFATAPSPKPQPVPVADATDVRFLPQVQEEVQRTLLSASAGEQVARSFEELAVALGQEHRSLDEIAEDMLRPMLQEWLDDNLPTLVERLVREEIERVARGPRR